MKQMRLFLMSGVPGSGKSTYGKKFVKEHPEVVYISRDEIRMSIITDNDQYFSKEKQVFREFAAAAKTVLDNGGTVLLDASHLNWPSVNKTLRALNWKDDYTIIRMDTSYDKAIAQNAKRSGRALVPETEIKNMWDKMDDPTKYCNNVIFVEWRDLNE